MVSVAGTGKFQRKGAKTQRNFIGRNNACPGNQTGVFKRQVREREIMPEDQAPIPPPIEPPPPVAPASPPRPPSPNPESQARTWNMLCHLSALAGFVVPFGNIFGPLLVWQIKKNEFPSVEVHGKAALNFQITVMIAVLVAIFAGIILLIIGIGILLIFGAIAINFCGIIFAIIAGIKANNGEDYKYPWSLELVK
jgi:uncharacterized protein